MVFCGKPSKGCSHCRIRRIKCDRVDPACSQCLRAGKVCPGYRDQLSLLFRDESDKVVRKANVPKSTAEYRKVSRIQANSANDSDYSASTCPTSSVTPPNRSPQALVAPTGALPTRSLSSECLDEGIVFFFNHYVTLVSNFPTGKVDLPDSPIWATLFVDKSINNAVSSVGYAGLSNVTKNPEHMVVARKKYATSLRNITLALKDTANADLDATFRSVLLLAAFEIVNGGSYGSGAGLCGVHLDGGAAILKLIAAKQPQQAPAVRIQLQFVFSVYIKCLRAGEVAPPSMNEWSQQAKKAMSPDDAHATRLAESVFRFTNFHASIRSKLLTDSKIIVREALVLDADLEKWEMQLPQSWRYSIEHRTEESEVVYQGVSHLYRDFWTARVYNNYRWSRILVNELLIVHMARLRSFPSGDTSQQTRSLAIISRLATDICSSVFSQFHKPSLVEEAKKRGVPALSGCFLLIFPLAVAGSAMGVSDDLHDYVIRMFENMGHRMGVAQALTMIAPTKLQREKWKLVSDRPSYYWCLSGSKV